MTARDASSQVPVPAGWSSGSDALGAWAQEPRTGIRFRPIPAGTYTVGLTEAQLEAAQQLGTPNITVDELTPALEVSLPPLLASELPISASTAELLGVGTAAEQPAHPAMLTRPEALDIAERVGCRLPFEAEWEPMCRAGTSSLFTWGWELPPSQAQLEGWMQWDMAAGRRNGWGFGGLYFGEWCADPYRPSHRPDARVQPDAHVIKGGGAQFWPWQDGEWVWCMPAMRMPSTDLFEDGRCAARLVVGSADDADPKEEAARSV